MIQTVLRYTLLYVIIIFGSIFVHYKTNKKLGGSIPIFILTSIVVLYIFGLFKGLLVGTYFISIISVILGIYALVRIPKDKLHKIVDSGTIFFTIIFYIFMITTFEKVSNTNGDEFSLWSLTTKQMYYNNLYQFYGYPPSPSLWEYFVCKVLGKYTQGIEISGLYIISFSFLLPLFEINKKESSKIYNILIGIICICIPGIFSVMYFYEAPYADAFLGLLIGYVFIETYISKSKNNNYKFYIPIAFMVMALTKATGLYMGLIILISYSIVKFFNELKNNKKHYRNEYIFTFFIFFIMCITIISWKVYYKINYIDGFSDVEKIVSEGKDTLTIKEMITSFVSVAIKSTNESFEGDFIQENLINSIINKNLGTGYIELKIGSFILLYFGLNLLFYKKTQSLKIKNVLLFTAISLCVYILFLQTAYFTKFNIVESYAHNSFERYMASYFIAILMLSIVMIIDIDRKKGNIDIALITIAILLITPLKDVTNATINAGFYNKKISNQLRSTVLDTNELKEKVSRNSKIYIINQQLEDKKFQYYMLPENDVTMGIYFGNNHIKNERDYFLKLIYKYFDYVYIRATDDYFNSNYSDLFGETIEEKQVYKVIKNEVENNIKLERVD